MADSNVTFAGSVGLASGGADPGVPPVEPLVSVISPVYNEEAVVAEFVRRIAAAVWLALGPLRLRDRARQRR